MYPNFLGRVAPNLIQKCLWKSIVEPSVPQPPKVPKRRPGPAQGIPLQQTAISWVTQVYGPGWRELLHSSHELQVAEPLLFCRVCGHYSPHSRYVGPLTELCTGPPAQRSSAQKRLKRLMESREHPETRAELGPVVSIPPGLRS